jgi:hypothetical protein
VDIYPRGLLFSKVQVIQAWKATVAQDTKSGLNIFDHVNGEFTGVNTNPAGDELLVSVHSDDDVFAGTKLELLQEQIFGVGILLDLRDPLLIGTIKVWVLLENGGLGNFLALK